MTKHTIDRRTFIQGTVTLAVAGPVIASVVPTPPAPTGITFGPFENAVPKELYCVLYDHVGNVLTRVKGVVASVSKGRADFNIPTTDVHYQGKDGERMKISICRGDDELCWHESPVMFAGDSLHITGLSITLL